LHGGFQGQTFAGGSNTFEAKGRHEHRCLMHCVCAPVLPAGRLTCARVTVRKQQQQQQQQVPAASSIPSRCPSCVLYSCPWL
jgi:hypothetical protein